MPTPKAGEKRVHFIERCMADPEAGADFPRQDQRYAFCTSQYTRDSAPTIQTNDRNTYTVSQRERTDQGYLMVPGRVARTGVQQYLASELAPDEGKPDPGGLRDRPAYELVNVYRPPEEVFSPDSLATYKSADVTDNHPSELVSADTYREYAKGHTLGDGRQEGEYVVVDMLIKDKAAIDAVESGKVELSAGYENEYHYEPGTAPDGTDYEYVQRNIRINHIALVDKARAGHNAKLFDHNGGLFMSTITLDGKTVKVGDEPTAQLIQQAFDAQSEKMGGMEEKVQAAKDEYEKMKKEMDEMKAAKDAQGEELEKAKEASSDSAIADRLKVVMAARDNAAKIAGESFSCDSMDPLTIKREALKAARPTIDWDSQSEHYVAAAWDMETTKPEAETTRDRAAQTAAQFGKDLEAAYTGDNGQMVGSSAYSQFLQGGAK